MLLLSATWFLYSEQAVADMELTPNKVVDGFLIQFIIIEAFWSVQVSHT